MGVGPPTWPSLARTCTVGGGGVRRRGRMADPAARGGPAYDPAMRCAGIPPPCARSRPARPASPALRISQPRRAPGRRRHAPPAPIARAPTGARRYRYRRLRGISFRYAREKDGVQFRVTERLPLDRRGRNRRRDGLCLSHSTETLPEQCLDRLDPRSMIGDGDLLAEALAALRAGAGRPGLSCGAGRGLEQHGAYCLELLGGRQGDGGPHCRR